MIKTKSFRELIVWRKSMNLVVKVYKLTENFPKSEIYGLTSQMRRSAVALPSNIAEGYIRHHTKEYAQFINVAFASGAELETQLEISKKLEYITNKDYNEAQFLLEEVMKMLNRLLQILKTSS